MERFKVGNGSPGSGVTGVTGENDLIRDWLHSRDERCYGSNEGFSGGEIKTVLSAISALVLRQTDSALVELHIQPCIM